MKINNLIGIEQTFRMKEQGLYFQNRWTGQSTALAMEAIATAIKNPGTWIDFHDHFYSFKADRFLLNTIRDIVNRLEFKHFKFKTNPCQIRFDLWQTYEEVDIKLFIPIGG